MKPLFNLPLRIQKPRTHGLTVVIDTGAPTQFFTDVIASHGHLIDFIKFGWLTAYVTQDLNKKLSVLKNANIPFFFGGTFFEKALLQNKLAEFIKYVSSCGTEFIEVSNGTIDLSHTQKANYIHELAKNFLVLSEVGFKDAKRSEQFQHAQWLECIKKDLAAGASYVITETRESGSSGLCLPNGELRLNLVEEILQAGFNTQQLIFEAPNKMLQNYFIHQLGANVNLANIALTDSVALETLRLGLRSETLSLHETQSEIHYA